LYIAERIVSAHRGRIEVDSSAERTTFTVRLPRHS
jgi:signal transduction histidine kinase